MKFLADPKKFLTEAGFDFEGTTKVNVYENNANAVYAILPDVITPEFGKLIGERFAAKGQEIPENFEVRFIKNSAVTLNLVLPMKPKSFSNELSESDLGRIAGGDIEAVTTNTTGVVELEVAEVSVTTTTVAQDFEAASTVFAVAELAVVLI
ncbi:MAG: hypothetical protein IPH20_21595 [Bacteroidales bacterium]|nr:hypothetical protein [Bacteroidales bacterium]